MDYRIGLDLGTNSIGWALLELSDNKPSKIIKTGVRIFPDGRNPKDKTSLAVKRRLARQQRRMHDRFLKRQKRLMAALITFKLMPPTDSERKALEHLDPYELRAKGLDKLLKSGELGRAIFHLSKRRGFKSNRKTDSGADDTGIVKSSTDKTRQSIKETDCRTYGEWLNKRRRDGKGVLARTVGEGKDKEYEVYADRALIEEELTKLWDRQRELGNTYCSDKAFEAIRGAIFFQRDLRPVNPGKCTLEIDEFRGPLANLYAQQFRIYQELNNLLIIDENYEERKLSRDERDKVANALLTSQKKTFQQINRLLGLPDWTKFNLESESRGYLKGDETAWVLAKKDHFGKAWFEFSENKQVEIIDQLLNNESEKDVIQYLEDNFSLDHATAQKVTHCRLPEGYGNLSICAITKILPHLKENVITFDKAALLAGYNHSNFDVDEIYPELPYYGQILEHHTGKPNELSSNADEAKYGRIANPTVHIALNELRKVVNGIIRKYGHPQEIHLEVVRDLKNSQAAKKEIIKRQNDNRRNNERYARELEPLGEKNNYDNRLRFKLWEELGASPLDRKCVFTGEQISLSRLFSEEVEIEHLIPFSRCLDNGIGNKTLAMRKANRDKRNLTPFEAFGNSDNGYSWDDILDRADALPRHKRARFAANAAETFANQDEWLARQLNDTAYISKVARHYLTAVCCKENVKTIPGKLTALFRESLGLNRLIGDTAQKERNDHRHHAVDAIVVGLTERSLLQKASRHYKFAREQKFKRLLENMPVPWEGFTEEAISSLSALAVSHKPDHGVEAQLHNDSAFGIVEPPNDKGVSMVVRRKPLVDLSEKDITKIRDIRLANDITEYIKKSSLGFKDALKTFSRDRKIYRCRLIEPMTVIPIKDENNSAYKAYKGDSNYCYEIFELENGKWDGKIISTFQANQNDYKLFRLDSKRFLKQSFCGRSLVMRLCANDTIAITQHGRQLLRVVKISSGIITLAAINEANTDARNRNKDDPFKLFSKSPNGLRSLDARRVFIDSIGRVKDPKG